MSKGGGSTVSTQVDPQTQAYVNQMRQYAQGAVGIGGSPSPAPQQGFGGSGFQRPFGGMGGMASWGMPGGFGRPQTPAMPGATGAPVLPQAVLDAQQQYQKYAQGGNLGFSALTGDAGAAQQFQNPYLSQMNPFFAQQRALAVQGANDQATQMGAFGGDRSQIGAAVAGGQADQNQAAFQVQAFNEAMQRAAQAANLGYGAGAQAAFLPQQYYSGQLGLLNQGLGPYGQTQTQQTQSDPFSQLLGTGLSVASLFTRGGLFAKGVGAAAPGIIGI